MIRKVCIFLFALMFFLLAMNFMPAAGRTAYAVTTPEGLRFNTLTKTVTGYYGGSSAVEVPGTIDGVTVEKIGSDAFKGTDVLSVTLTVEHIGNREPGV